ncbi:hypothetical protein [Thalassospira tepidiphila]|uniref:Uncharacterized protein n=2 Tax=Thalassospira tepidiphila TaxID=393657 RepID=A0A853KZV5_9PROT|nr:hypothetical protein [Thalassospira tepidiphila]NJB76576.1 hypothetical protein [Thalassospira tepidiphila]OAZ09904.1 hypothetical protein TH4_12045 [Thalassospira tepidiphila MCCC 1A03514]
MSQVIEKIRKRSRHTKQITITLGMLTILSMVYLSYTAIERFGGDTGSTTIGSLIFPGSSADDLDPKALEAIDINVKTGDISTSAGSAHIYDVLSKLLVRFAALALPIMFLYFSFSTVKYLTRLSMFWDSRADMLELHLLDREFPDHLINYLDTNSINFSETKTGRLEKILKERIND